MKDPDSIDRILIATDGSPGSLAAVEEGVRLAQRLGADVTFVAVAQPPLPVLGDPYYQRALSENLGTMRAALAKAIPYAEERRVTYETELLEGSPAKAVLELARSRDIDLIVVGSVALMPKAEIEGEVGDQHMGLQARLMSRITDPVVARALA